MAPLPETTAVAAAAPAAERSRRTANPSERASERARKVGLKLLVSSTHPRWFATAVADLHALLSDHLHCERKAAESALGLVRRYPHRLGTVESLGRLAHEETSHVVQVSLIFARRGWAPRADTPNHYARALLAEVRGREPERLVDLLLVAAFIEARSHERLDLLARGFAASSEPELAASYQALATAEERHAEIYLELAAPLVPAQALAARLEALAIREAQVLAELPYASRIH